MMFAKKFGRERAKTWDARSGFLWEEERRRPSNNPDAVIEGRRRREGNGWVMEIYIKVPSQIAHMWREKVGGFLPMVEVSPHRLTPQRYTPPVIWDAQQFSAESSSKLTHLLPSCSRCIVWVGRCQDRIWRAKPRKLVFAAESGAIFMKIDTGPWGSYDAAE
jgi:hypothetical protein